MLWISARFPLRGWIPAIVVSCALSLLLVLALFRGFFSGFSGFHPSTKTSTYKFQFHLDKGRTFVSVTRLNEGAIVVI